MPNAGEYFIDNVTSPDQGPISFQLAAGQSIEINIEPNARVYGSYITLLGRRQSFEYDAVCIPRPTDTPTNTPTNTATDTPSVTPSNTPTNTATRTPPSYQLNLSHIECVNFQTEVHFVLLGLPDGITPGTLVYSYTDESGQSVSRSVSPGPHTGNVWHYYDYPFSNGFINVTGATVDVDGDPVVLHNPGEYSGIYNCSVTDTPTNTPSDTPTNTYTPSVTPSNTPTNTYTPSVTPSDTPTNTYTPSITPSNTYTPSNTPTNTYTPSNTPTDTYTPSNTPTNTPTDTYTPTATNTEIPPGLSVGGQCSEVTGELSFTVNNNGGGPLNETVTYTVTGPNGYSQTGTFGPLASTDTVTFDLGVVEPGTYTFNAPYSNGTLNANNRSDMRRATRGDC